MALPKISITVEAQTRSAEAGLDRVEAGLDDVTRASARASSQSKKMGGQFDATARRSAGFTRGVQNAAFQVGDFAVQVGAGTQASRALALQLPQLLGGFGVMGAVMGAVVAIALPLNTALSDMAGQGRDLTEVFGTLQPLVSTLADAMTSVRAAFVGAAEAVINNLDRIIITAGVAAAVFAGKFVAAFVAARIATFSLSAALVTLRGALIRTGIGALIVGIGEAIFQFTRLSEAAGGFGNALVLLKDVAVETWQRIREGGGALSDSLAAAAAHVKASFLNAFAAILQKFAELTQRVADGINSLFGTNLQGIGAGAAGALDQISDQATLTANSLSRIASGNFDALDRPFESIEKIRDLLASMKDERITLPDILGIGGGGEDGSSGAKKLDEELSAQEKRIAEHLSRIKAMTQGTLSDKLGAWSGYFGNLAALTGTNNQKLLGIQKSFAAAQALIDAWGAHNKVLNDPTLPWWARVASATQVLAAGIGAVSAIKSVTAGGGQTAAGGGGVATGATGGGAAPEPQVSRNVAIQLQGDTFGRSSVLDLINQINDAIDDGAATIRLV